VLEAAATSSRRQSLTQKEGKGKIRTPGATERSGAIGEKSRREHNYLRARGKGQEGLFQTLSGRGEKDDGDRTEKGKKWGEVKNAS